MGIGSYAGNSDETDKQKPSPDIYQGGATGLSTAATDNISELLFKILEFTQHRQKILIQNINFADRPGFVPKDLPVDEYLARLRVHGPGVRELLTRKITVLR